MTKYKSNMLNIKEIRQVLGFNKNLTSVNYDKNTNCISFQFLHGCSFDMGEHDCDYGAFDEFAYSCIDDFDSEHLSDTAIINKSRQVYHAIVKHFQKQTRLQTFLIDAHKQISKKILTSKTDSHIFTARLTAAQKGNCQSAMATL